MANVEDFRIQCPSWIEINHPDSYKRAYPNIFGMRSRDQNVLRAFLSEIAAEQVSVPPQDMYLFEDAYASDLTLAYDKDKNLLNVSKIDHFDIFNFDQINSFSEGQIPYIDENCAYIFKAGKNNYGHVLIEMMPKLELLVKGNFDCDVILLPSLPASLEKIVVETTKKIYGERFRFVKLTSPLLQVRNLYFPGPVTTHNHQKSRTVSEFVEKILASFELKQDQSLPERKLYVSRKKENNRRMENEEELEQKLSQEGFEIIHPQNYSFFEQVALFHSASHVAGPLGAGLSNTIFCRPGTKVSMITPGMYDFFFYDIACLKDLKFSWIFTAPIKFPSVEDLHATWHADVELVVKAIRDSL